VLPDARPEVIQVRPCPDPKFGDTNGLTHRTGERTKSRTRAKLATDVLASSKSAIGASGLKSPALAFSIFA